MDNEKFVQIVPATGHYVIWDVDGEMDIAPVSLFALRADGEIATLVLDWSAGLMNDPIDDRNFVGVVPQKGDCEEAWRYYKEHKQGKLVAAQAAERSTEWL